MGRKVSLSFLPTCGSPGKTLSFRAGDLEDMGVTGETESYIDSVIQGLCSDRFFFKPEKTNSILEEAKAKENENEKEKEKEKEGVLGLKENVSMIEMESTDPFVDFKKSMQEMVEADEGFKEWENLQELLSLYLSLNDKINHGYIIGAFVDLLLVNNCSSSSCSEMNGQDQSLLESDSSNNKKMIIISSESPEFATSFTSSASASASASASSSGTCSLDDDDDDDGHGDDEDHNSDKKKVVSDVSFSSSKI